MDGVVIDSGPLHMEAWEITLTKEGIANSREFFRQRFGMRDSEVEPRLIGLMSDEDVDALAEKKSTVFQALVQQRGKATHGIRSFIDHLHTLDVLTALASHASKQEIGTVLDAVGLGGKLQVVVTREHGVASKPAPDIFLYAAQQLNVTPGASVVFEDAISGIEAARQAGATIVGITTSHSLGELSHADLVIKDFTDPTLRDFFERV